MTKQSLTHAQALAALDAVHEQLDLWTALYKMGGDLKMATAADMLRVLMKNAAAKADTCTTLGCDLPATTAGVYDDGHTRESASYCTACAKVLATAGEFTPDVEHRCTTDSTILGRWTAYCACGWASAESSNEGWVIGEYRKHAGEPL